MKRTAVVCLVALAMACTFTFALLVPARALAAPPPGGEHFVCFLSDLGLDAPAAERALRPAGLIEDHHRPGFLRHGPAHPHHRAGRHAPARFICCWINW